MCVENCNCKMAYHNIVDDNSPECCSVHNITIKTITNVKCIKCKHPYILLNKQECNHCITYNNMIKTVEKNKMKLNQLISNNNCIIGSDNEIFERLIRLSCDRSMCRCLMFDDYYIDPLTNFVYEIALNYTDENNKLLFFYKLSSHPTLDELNSSGHHTFYYNKLL